jgi:hypothetical protein
MSRRRRLLEVSRGSHMLPTPPASRGWAASAEEEQKPLLFSSFYFVVRTLSVHSFFSETLGSQLTRLLDLVKGRIYKI